MQNATLKKVDSYVAWQVGDTSPLAISSVARVGIITTYKGTYDPDWRVICEFGDPCPTPVSIWLNTTCGRFVVRTPTYWLKTDDRVLKFLSQHAAEEYATACRYSLLDEVYED